MPFDIVHCDLWTSPLASSFRHKYYLLVLDVFTKFLWTFPLTYKYQVYSVFLQFRALIRTQFERDIKNIQYENGGEFGNG